VSSDYTENGAQQCSQDDAKSIEFRFVAHNLAPESHFAALGGTGERARPHTSRPHNKPSPTSPPPRSTPRPSLRLRAVAGLQGFVADLADFTQQL
jgi:hypothetical protein